MPGLGITLGSKLTEFRLYRAWMPFGRMVAEGVKLALRYRGDGTASEFPTTLNVSVTNRCNLACECCYNRDNRGASELGINDFASLVAQAAPYRAGIFLTGGEPLVRSDVFDILALSRKAGLKTGLVSNGILLEPSMVDRLVGIGLDMVVLSVRGDRTLHDAEVNRPGAYDVLRNAAVRLAERMPRSGIQLNYVLTGESSATVEAFLDDVLPLPGVVVRLGHLSFATPSEADAHKVVWKARMGDTAPALFTFLHDVSPEQFADLPRILTNRRHPRLTTRPVLSPSECSEWYAPGYASRRRCLFIWHSTNIQADGQVFPCQYYPYSMGNILEEPLQQIWNNKRYRSFRREIRRGLLPGCARCCKL